MVNGSTSISSNGAVCVWVVVPYTRATTAMTNAAWYFVFVVFRYFFFFFDFSFFFYVFILICCIFHSGLNRKSVKVPQILGIGWLPSVCFSFISNNGVYEFTLLFYWDSYVRLIDTLIFPPRKVFLIQTGCELSVGDQIAFKINVMRWVLGCHWWPKGNRLQPSVNEHFLPADRYQDQAELLAIFECDINIFDALLLTEIFHCSLGWRECFCCCCFRRVIPTTTVDNMGFLWIF